MTTKRFVFTLLCVCCLGSILALSVMHIKLDITSFNHNSVSNILLYRNTYQPLELTGKININTADAKELDKLPGIGPSLAMAIIKERTEHKFLYPEDLMSVSGVGEKTYENIIPYIFIE